MGHRALIGYCDHFWGSHGCSLPEGHTGSIHQCGTENSAYGVCSQMTKANSRGAAWVRFWYTNEPPRWGQWSHDWKWFTNHGTIR